jgi:hypothetical protein
MGIVPISSSPGVQRDGTLFSAQAYTDAEWCRFYRGKPKKIGGFRELSRGLAGIGRGMYSATINAYAYMHIGSANKLERLNVELATGTTTGVSDRTPAGFATHASNLWQFASEFDTGSTLNYILAHAAPNLTNIANDTTGPVYYGNMTTTAALTAVASSSVSGGIVVLHPYLFNYGSDGYLGWSVANAPTNLTGAGSGAVRPTASKIVRGLPLRGGPGTSPAGLFWSLDALSRVTFVGGSSVFGFDTISASSSIMSAQAVVEHNGVYYWPSVSGFVMFNGVMKDIPNTFNHAWFYNNVNTSYLPKIFGLKIPSWDEIWWCFPTLQSTECNHALVYNYGENYWYDTSLPGNGRSCGFYEQVFPYPLMVDAGLNTSSLVSLWQHEYGVDEVSGLVPTTLAVRSRFRTNQKSLIAPSANAPGQDRALSVSVVEPDFTQTGDLTMRVYGAANATVKSPPQIGDDVTIPDPNTGTAGSADKTPGLTVTQRLIQFEFESNVAGGDFEAGNILAHVEDGDNRRQT